MSRIDAKEIDFAGGLNAPIYHGSGDREAEIAALLSISNDRGGSLGPGWYSGLSSGLGGHMRGLAPSEREYGGGSNADLLGPNRNNSFHVPSPSIPPFTPHLHLYQHPPSPLSRSPTSTDSSTLYQSPPLVDREPLPRHSLSNNLPSNNSNISRSTLLWGNFEPWMDEEYAKQVCKLLNWEPIHIKVPQPPPDPATGQQPNNPGYCFLTFSTPSQAANVLAQVNNTGKGSTMTMPNSSKPFVLNWAPAVQPSISAPLHPAMTAYTNNTQQYQKEYSIFVGDLAPETSNSDLVAVFRNPVLGLRNDREPKFIRPFLSCKSAKIMLDPSTGVSRGYGFVRFTDEADQQRALIEMHGLYCLSRPMRISPATAKFKPTSGISMDYSHGQPNVPLANVDSQPVTVAVPLPAAAQAKSVSAPIAATGSNNSLGSNSVQGSSSNGSIGGSSSGASLSSNAASGGPPNNDVKIGNGLGVSGLFGEAQLRQVFGQTDGYLMTEESLKHHAHARAILGNLMGPNGEQLTSNDPYNTTVFVGGLSPLISEETLRTFFAPFGDIHYVKVPVGKHCGFVQFVRKADAERAIEKMQGFPIGGSRIRLSWGRSQYKAAQAAAQAAQAAALQAQYSTQMTPEQALQLMYQLSQQGYITGSNAASNGNSNDTGLAGDRSGPNISSSLLPDVRMNPGRDTPQHVEAFSSNAYQPRVDVHRMLSTFSPFSPDPDSFVEEAKSRDRPAVTRPETLPRSSRAYVSGYHLQDIQNVDGGRTNRKPSPPGPLPNTSRYGSYFDMTDRTLSRPEPYPRPLGHAETDHHDLEDLNGTLASLDLDRPWKSPDASGGITNGRHHTTKALSPN